MERMQLGGVVPGDIVEGVAVVVERRQGTTKQGKPYLDLRIGNATGTLPARVWSDQMATWGGVEEGRGIGGVAEVVAGWKNGGPELSFHQVGPLPVGDPIELELNPLCRESRASLELRFAIVEATIERQGMGALLQAVLGHVGWERYASAPGAKSHHHAYIHGLLEHSVEVAELALAIAHRPCYRGMVDLDAIVVGAVLHDVGKVSMYRWVCEKTGRPVRIDYAPIGRMIDHIVLGPMLVQAVVDKHWPMLKEAGCRCIDVRHLVHVMVSHHGTVEWGSPTPPVTLEAQIIHQADNASAKVRGLADVLEAQVSDEAGWITAPGWPHRRPVLYLAELSRSDEDPTGCGMRKNKDEIRSPMVDNGNGTSNGGNG
jgi:3'-5' exoribonuclease